MYVGYVIFVALTFDLQLYIFRYAIFHVHGNISTKFGDHTTDHLTVTAHFVLDLHES